MPPQSPSYKVFDAVPVSGTNTYYSGSPIAGNANNQGSATPNGRTLSYIGQFTGTAAGTLTVEASNSNENDIRAGTEIWVTNDQVTGSGFTAGAATVTGGQVNGAAKFAVALTRNAFLRIRLKYVNASGSGTLTVIATSKGV